MVQSAGINIFKLENNENVQLFLIILFYSKMFLIHGQRTQISNSWKYVCTQKVTMNILFSIQPSLLLSIL